MGLKSVGKKSDPDSTPAGESAFSMAASIFKLWSDLKAVQANSAGSQDEIQKSRLENPNKNKMFRGSIFIFSPRNQKSKIFYFFLMSQKCPFWWYKYKAFGTKSS